MMMMMMMMMMMSELGPTSAVGAVACIPSSTLTLIAADHVDTDRLGSTILRITDALVYICHTHHAHDGRYVSLTMFGQTSH